MVALAIANGRPPAMIGARTFYASRCGLRADGVRTGGTSGTDNSARLQKILDDWGTDPLRFIFDGDHNGLVYLLNTVYLYQNTEFCTEHGAWLLRMPYPNSSTGMIRNKNPIPSGAVTDNNIRLIGLRIDGNRRNGGSGGTDPVNPWANGAGNPVPTIGMYGISDLYVQNVVIHDSPSYALHLSNGHDCDIYGLRRTQNPGDTGLGDSVLQIEGNSAGIRWVGGSGTTNDDPLAINATDGTLTPDAGFEAGTVNHGPITDVDAIGLQFYSSGSPCRFLSATAADYIKRVRISNITASCGYAGFTFDNFAISGDGHGYCEDITIENASISSVEWPAVILQRCYVNQLRIRNLKLNGCTFTGTYYDSITPNAPVVITAGSKVRGLELDVQMYDSAGTVTGPLIQMSGGDVDDVEITARTDRANNPAIADGLLRHTGGQLGRVRFKGCRVDGYRNLANIISPALCGAVELAGVMHTNAIGGALVRVDGTTLPRLRAAGLNAQRLSETVNSGAIIDSKDDGTADGFTLKRLDRFTGTNGTSLSAHTPDDGGSAWTLGSGTWTLNASNQGVRTSTGNNEHCWLDAAVSSGRVSCLMNTGANVANAYVGLVGRVTDDSNLWVAILNPFPSSGNPRVDLYDQITGSYTLRGSVDLALAASTVYRFEMVFKSNDILVFVDGKFIVAYNSSFNNTATKFGLTSSAGTPGGRTFDDFLVMG